MTELETQRLQDFRMILRYHLCNKIKHFGCTPKEFYAACKLYEMAKKTHTYSKRIFELLAFVNVSGLSRTQVHSIFGYYKTGTSRKWISYKKLIEDSDISVRKYGTQYCKKADTRRHFTNCYFLPYEEIAKVFADEELLSKVLDATSDLYTDRQRCLIFNQIIGVEVVRDSNGNIVRDKNGKVVTVKHTRSRYKTNKQILQEKAEAEELSDNDLDDLINNIEL